MMARVIDPDRHCPSCGAFRSQWQHALRRGLVMFAPHECSNDAKSFCGADEFVCSACGLHIEDWVRLALDEDTGETNVRSFEMKYCPGCGAKVVE